MRWLPFALLALACQAPPTHVHCLRVDRAEDFSGRFLHALALDDGTVSEPVEVLWAQQEDFLLAVDPGAGVRLGFSVEARFEARDVSDNRCGLELEADTTRPPTLRSHMRVDLSVDHSARAARTLVPELTEPLAFFVFQEREDDFEERRPIRIRDSEGRMTSLETSALYFRDDTNETFWVRHSFDRID